MVARLFDLTRPRHAIFGEKDWQQLKVIEAMVAESDGRWGGLEIAAHPTRREPDGLAMSSRNALLTAEERAAGLGLSRALNEAQRLATVGRPTRRIEEAMRAILVKHQLRTEYAVVRHADTLLPIEAIEESVPARALIAARAGSVRLIDNMGVGS